MGPPRRAQLRRPAYANLCMPTILSRREAAAGPEAPRQEEHL
eukprot:gene15294-20819_t